jgi:glycosyltransferase involved in cell wall biosynthesis
VRVAIFTETAAPQVNGIVRRLDQTIGLLRDGGDEVMVFAPVAAGGTWRGAELVGVPCFPLPMYPDLSVGMPRPAIRPWLARFRPDVVHVVNPALLGAGGILYARMLGIPVVASFHTHLPRYLHHYGLGVFESLAWDMVRSLHNQATLNLCISNPVADELRGRGVERVAVGWRGGVDTELFNPAQRSWAMRSLLTDGHPEAPLILALGRLAAEKGLEMFSELLPAIPGARLVFVGDGPHRPVLEARFAGMPVHFTGFLSGGELASAVASSDVLVFPSQTDTLGLVLLEAMAAGTPVVAAASGGVTDVVDDGRNGFLFPPGNAGAAVDAVRIVLENPARRELLRLAGRLQAERWTWPAAVADLRGWYRQAIEAETLKTAA